MPTNPEPTQPLTDEELVRMRERHQLEWIERPDRVIGERDDPWCRECGEQHPCEPARLLDEVDRLKREHADFREMSMMTLHSQTAEIDRLRAALDQSREGQANG